MCMCMCMCVCVCVCVCMCVCMYIGIVSPLHYDATHSFLAQVRGRKRMVLWDAGFHPTPTPHPPHPHPHPPKTVVFLFFLLYGIASVSIHVSSHVFEHCVCSIRVSSHVFGYCRSFYTRCTPVRVVRVRAPISHTWPSFAVIPPNFDTLTRVFVLSAFECHRNLCTLTRNVCSVDITEFLDAFYVYPPDHPLYRRSRVDLQVRGVESRESTYYCFCVHTRTCVCACVRACARVFLFLVSLGSSPQHVPRANIQTCMHMHM
jgi:hypothetical protein